MTITEGKSHDFTAARTLTRQILRLLQLNLFERRDLMAPLRGDSPEPMASPLQTRLRFA